MKKVVILLICIAMIFSLSACSEKEVSEKQIFSDVENLEVFSNLNVEISDFNIIKRQTSPEDKIDYVYVTVKAANEDLSIIRNYLLTYILYNDGWIFEKYESYDNPDLPNETIPLHGVSFEQVYNDLDALDAEEYRSLFENLIGVERVHGNNMLISAGAYLPMDESGVCHYCTDIEYEYCTFYEIVNIPVTYHFGGGDYNSDGYKWYLSIENDYIERSVELHDGILGYWQWFDGTSDEASCPKGYFNVTSHNGATCQASLNLWVEDSYYAGQLFDTATVENAVLEIAPIANSKDVYNEVYLNWISPQPNKGDDWSKVSICLDDRFTVPHSEAIGILRDSWYVKSYFVKG